MNEHYRAMMVAIDTQLQERIEALSPLKETSCSRLYLARGRQTYVVKQAKKENIRQEYDNHRTVYDCWRQEADHVDFRVPETYCISEDQTYYVMAYIEGAKNLNDLLRQDLEDIRKPFAEVGVSLRQYHRVMTDHLGQDPENILSHDTMEQLLGRERAARLLADFATFNEETYRVIFKDVTASNILLGGDGRVYFIDFQHIRYWAPLYYDLARFIDTTQALTLVHRPLFFLKERHKINSVLRCFLDGYNGEFNEADLRRMQGVHRREHIQMKRKHGWLDAVVLSLIYRFLKV